MLGRNIKGSLPDVIVFSLKTLVGAVAFILVGFLFVQFSSELQDSQIGDTAVGSKTLDFITSIGTERIGTYFLILFAFDFIAIILTSFLITLSPVFFILYIIFISFSIAISIFSMTFYNRISEISVLGSYIADQSIINFIIQYAPIFTLVVGAISALIIMAKPGEGVTRL